MADPGGVNQVVTVPSFVDTEFVGTVSVGFSLDDETAQQFKRLTNSEIAFAVNHQIEASTLPDRYSPQLETLVGTKDVHVIRLGDGEYVAVSRVLPLPADRQSGDVRKRRRSRRHSSCGRAPSVFAFLNAVHRELAVTAFLAVLAATLVSYAVARTVTRPLDAITATMREMATTGDLTQKDRALPNGAMAGRGCASARDDLQHHDRFDRALSARRSPARTPVVARAALDGRRARDSEPADDHQHRASRVEAAKPDASQSGTRRWPTSTRKSRG